MIDPKLALAITMHSSKGMYALLLGSGISRSAGIPTGWDIVLDLIRKLAHLHGADCGPDPEGWYRTHIGSEPDYSDILDRVTRSSAERMQLLRSYFEPTGEERQEQRKSPTAAHHAIATLVAKGYIRVIVTTNFDRLLEQALSGAGVQPSVIGTTDGVVGAIPIIHSPCTVVKVHGDYLDSRIRNTKTELSGYEKPLDALLDRLFDEFGLLVCGWSAEWDVALRAALERCAAHRFGTYWVLRGEIGGVAEKLTGLRRAIVLPVSDADSFFRDLVEKIQALEDYAINDPVSPRVAVARMKRYLSIPEQRINLHDFVNAETERVHASITGTRFSAQGNTPNPETTSQRLRSYEAELNSLLPMLACGGYWASEEHYAILLRSLKRIADDGADQNRLIILPQLRSYPGALLFYGLCTAALARGNYEFLWHLFSMRIRTVEDPPDEPIIIALSPFRVLDLSLQKQLLPGRERELTPLSNHMFDMLREPLREYLPADRMYEDTFDWFEYLLGLVYCDQSVTADQLESMKTDADWYMWAPFGRFFSKGNLIDGGIGRPTELHTGEPYPERVVAALRAGFFGSSGERYRLIKHGFDIFLTRVRRQTHNW